MTLHDERGGGGFNQIRLALCFGAPGPMLYMASGLFYLTRAWPFF